MKYDSIDIALATRKVQNPNWIVGFERTCRLFGGGSKSPVVLKKMFEHCRTIILVSNDKYGSNYINPLVVHSIENQKYLPANLLRHPALLDNFIATGSL